MEGYFIVYKNPVENGDLDIKCDLDPQKAKNMVPLEQHKLYTEVEVAGNVIKSLKYTDKETKEKYFNKLLSLAQAGLVGELAQPVLALDSLEKLKDEIVMVEGQRIKNTYMKKLGIFSFIGIVLSLIVYAISSYFKFDIAIAYSLSWLGAMVGTWISFGARRFTFEFKHLSIIEDDMLNPIIRLIYIGVCAIVFTLFMQSGIFSIKLGSFSTENILLNKEVLIIVGILCGLIESKIGITIYNKARSIIGDDK